MGRGVSLPCTAIDSCNLTGKEDSRETVRQRDHNRQTGKDKQTTETDKKVDILHF